MSSDNKEENIRDQLNTLLQASSERTVQLCMAVVLYLKDTNEIRRFSVGLRKLMMSPQERTEENKKKRPWNRWVSHVMTMAKKDGLGDRMNEIAKAASIMKKHVMIHHKIGSKQAIKKLNDDENERKNVFNMFRNLLLPTKMGFKIEPKLCPADNDPKLVEKIMQIKKVSRRNAEDIADQNTTSKLLLNNQTRREEAELEVWQEYGSN